VRVEGTYTFLWFRVVQDGPSRTLRERLHSPTVCQEVAKCRRGVPKRLREDGTTDNKQCTEGLTITNVHNKAIVITE